MLFAYLRKGFYKSNIMPMTILCPFSVGWVKRQRNPTDFLGFMLLVWERLRSTTQPTNQGFFQFRQGIAITVQLIIFIQSIM